MTISSSGGFLATGGTAPLGTGGLPNASLALTSAELPEGGEFMAKHTCEMAGFDNDESPPLTWSGAPPETMSYAITFVDRTLVDQGDNLGYHWAIWDIPAETTSLPAHLPSGMALTSPISAQQSRESYLGPCPNFGGGTETHTYEFVLYALPAATISLAGMIDETMVTTLETEALATAKLSATSSASTGGF